MWGIQAMNPDTLPKYFKSKRIVCSSDQLYSNTRHQKIIARSIQPSSTADKISHRKPISRVDLFAVLVARCDNLVLHDIFRILTQFSTALPLIVRDLKDTDSIKYICLVPLLMSCVIRWASPQGVVQHNGLFLSPFKMLVAVRIGSPEEGKCGKSSILNQVMSKQHVFSSLSNTESEYGKPFTLDGTMEFCTLNHDTSSTLLWKSAVYSHYSRGTDQLLLLANFHGDILNYPETLEVLKTLASNFIIFLNTMSKSEMQEKYNEFESKVGETWSDHLYYILVDPVGGCADMAPARVIQTSQLRSNVTAKVLNKILSEAISSKPYDSSFNVEEFYNSKQVNLMTYPSFDRPNVVSYQKQIFQTLTFAPAIATRESHEFIRTAKSINYEKNCQELQQTALYDDLLSNQFAKIFCLPTPKKVQAISHLETNIFRLSAQEFTKMPKEINVLANEEFNVSLPSEIQGSKELSSPFDDMDNINIGIGGVYSHIRREFANHPFIKSNAYGSEAPSVDDLLESGTTLEILDGDDFRLYHWFDSVCRSIRIKYPSLKIFVVSIIGLKSSGKSTLLNALFGCKFAVSAGPCSRGIYMQILFLEKDLASDVGVEAIVILDTQDLGAHKNPNLSDRIYQKIATFAMSVSSLTLINVSGNSNRNLAAILHASIVAMSELRKFTPSPDVLVIHHLRERDGLKSMRKETDLTCTLKESFASTKCRLLNKFTSSVAQNDSYEMYTSSCKKFLGRINKRIESGDLLTFFPPFETNCHKNDIACHNFHEAVKNLYNSILYTIRITGTTHTFNDWHTHFPITVNEISQQSLPTDVVIASFLTMRDLEYKVSWVKLAINNAIRTHANKFRKGLLRAFNRYNENPHLTSISVWHNECREYLNRANEATKLMPYRCPSSCQECTKVVKYNDTLIKSFSRDGEGLQKQLQDLDQHINQSRDKVLNNLDEMAKNLHRHQESLKEIDEIVKRVIQERIKLRHSWPKDKWELDGMVEAVWIRIRETVSAKKVTSCVTQNMLDEINKAFGKNSAEVCKLRENKLPDLVSSGRHYCINVAGVNFTTMNDLECDLEQLSVEVRAKYQSKRYTNGMIVTLKGMVESVINKFEKDIVGKKLDSGFKSMATIFGLISFTRVMRNHENELMDQQSTYQILMERKGKYKQVGAIPICNNLNSL